MLTRLLDVFSGDMYLQGKSYTQWDKEDWRNHIAPSFQEHHIFNISIRDNFKMFYPDISDEEVMAQIYLAGKNIVYSSLCV